MFRSKLTMHTAYDRKDNAEPASITSLAVSRDHKTLYVGDARGRVFSWSVAEQPGRGMADHWLKDEGADQCVGCHVRYGLPPSKSVGSSHQLSEFSIPDSQFMSENTIAATAAKYSATDAAASSRKYHAYAF